MDEWIDYALDTGNKRLFYILTSIHGEEHIFYRMAIAREMIEEAIAYKNNGA